MGVIEIMNCILSLAFSWLTTIELYRLHLAVDGIRKFASLFQNLNQFLYKVCYLYPQDGKLVQEMCIFKTKIGEVGSRLLLKVCVIVSYIWRFTLCFHCSSLHLHN